MDDLLLGVGREVHGGGREARLQAGQRALREVERVGHAHQHHAPRPRRPLEDRVQDGLLLAVQLVDLVED